MADYSPWVNHGWVRGEITTDFTDKHGWGRLLSFILYFASMVNGLGGNRINNRVDR